MEQRYAKILATGMYLPEKVISNEELSERYGFDVSTYLSGITLRHIAAENECASDMGVKAAEAAYVKDNFLPGRRFKDLHDLNSQALEWCRKVDSKVHGTTGEIPLEALNKEPLLPLPDKAIRDKYRWETRNVTRDGFVSYDGAKYGIPLAV